MAKKQSFAEKSQKGKAEEIKMVKHVKSIRSEKTGNWRFNETMVRLVGGETLDTALNRINQESQALDIEMPVFNKEEEVVTATEEKTPAVEESVETETSE